MHRPRTLSGAALLLCGLLVMGGAAVVAVPGAEAASATLSVSPAAGPPTAKVHVTGGGFTAGETVDVSFDSTLLATTAAGSGGSLAADVVVPKTATPGSHTVSATGRTSGSTASAGFVVRTNWTQFRFSANRAGVQPFENVLNQSVVPMLQVAWADRLGNTVDFSSPAVVNGVAYIGSSDGVLWAYSATGCGSTASLCSNPLWRSTNLAQIMDSPTVSGGFVYVGSQTSASNASGKLDVFRADGCNQPVCPPLWQGLAGSQSILYSSPAVSGGSVYVAAFDGKLYAFPSAGCGQPTCAPTWTGQMGGSSESSPTVAGGLVYVAADDGKLYAFPAGGCGQPTCPPTWTGALGGPAYASSPAVVGTSVYVASDHALLAFPRSCGAPTCAPLWRGVHGPDFFYGSPAVHAGRVFIGMENGLGVFNSAGCGQPTCAPQHLYFGSGAQAAVESSPTIANGVVYVGRNTGQVLAWREQPCAQLQCSEIWSGFTRDPIVSSSPTVVDGRLYVGSADSLAGSRIGRLYVFTVNGVH